MAFEIRAFKVEAAILDFSLKFSRKVGAEKRNTTACTQLYIELIQGVRHCEEKK